MMHMKVLIPSMLVVLLIFWISQSALAHSGCCSAHGGVSGCGCADGTPLSTTCLSYYPGCSGAAATGSAPTDTFAPLTSQKPPGTATFKPLITTPLVTSNPAVRSTTPTPYPPHPTKR